MTARREAPAIWLRLRPRHLLPLVPLFIVAVTATWPQGDSSFLWHIRAGTIQIDRGRVLSADPFSLERFGESWRTQSWLPELAYGWLERVTGDIGWAQVASFSAVVIALLLVAVAVYRANRSPVATTVWMMLLVWLAAPWARPRPVVFSYTLIALLVLILLLGDRGDWAVVPVVWLFASVHGSWPLAIALIGLEAVRRRSKRLALVGLLATAAATLTAHGIGIWTILIDFLGVRSALDLLQEWKPPAFGEPLQAPYLLLVAAVVFAATRGRMSRRDLWVVLPFLVLGLTSRRLVLPAALVVAPYAASAWVPVRRTRPATRGEVMPALIGLVLVIAIVAPLVLVPHRLDEKRFPADETVTAAGAGPIFYSDVVGGYLIYRDGPEELVTIDDRAELYGVEYFESYLRAVGGHYRPFFSEVGIRSVIAVSDWSLREVLEDDGWRVVAEDDSFVTLLPPGDG